MPSRTTTRFGTVCAVTKLRFDTFGRVDPTGNTVRYPAAAGAVTVTFTTTTPAPEAGTPPRPVTCTLSVPCAATDAFGAPVPTRVSNTRTGGNDTNVPAWVGVPLR